MKLNITYGEDGLYHVRVFAKPDAEGRRPSKRISGPTRKDVQQQALAWQQEMEQQPEQPTFWEKLAALFD